MMRLALPLAFLLMVWCSVGAAPQDQFTAANQAYEQGRFTQAAVLYENLVTNGVRTASAWFNLGNARFKAGEIGEAIAAWRQAERLTPRDSALRANLGFARKKAAGDAEPHLPLLKVLTRWLTVNEWLSVAALAIFLFFLLLAWTEWRLSRGVPRPMATLIVTGIIALTFCGGSAASYSDSVLTQHAVAIKSSPARFGPLDEAKVAFQLTEGAEVTIHDSTAAWAQVREGSKNEGWVKRESLKMIRP